MHASTRFAALRAAAKVTLTASILGCGGATATEGAVQVAQRDDAATAVCTGVTSNLDEAVSQATFSCCLATLTSELYDGGSWRGSLDASTPAAKQCCTSIVGFVNQNGWAVLTDVDSSTVAANSEGIRESCCEALAGDGGLLVNRACTPWGPPVPPSMHLEVA